MTKRESYKKRKTSEAFEFISRGSNDFDHSYKHLYLFKREIDTYNGLFHMTRSLHPGVHTGKKWIGQGISTFSSYHITVDYHNKSAVSVYFNAQKIREDLALEYEESFLFVQCAAEKYYLVNKLFLDQKCQKELKANNFDYTYKDPSWKEVLEVMQWYGKRGEPSINIATANSWTKIMTVTEAQELFAWLKIDIQFPD